MGVMLFQNYFVMIILFASGLFIQNISNTENLRMKFLRRFFAKFI